MMPQMTFREPPEGAIVGESVPTENDQDAIDQGKVEELAARMKQHPAYEGYSDDERLELAKEKLQ